MLIVWMMAGGGRFSYAYDYDPLLLRAQASIFPKIIMLDKDVDKKVESGQLVVLIMHSSQEKSIAIKFKDLIKQQYKNKLGKKELIINLLAFEDFKYSRVVTAYFLLKGPEESHAQVTRQAANNNRLVFSYDYKDFNKNSLVSVLMKEKTYIYLNKNAIHDYDIKFMPLFYKIVKVVE